MLSNPEHAERPISKEERLNSYGIFVVTDSSAKELSLEIKEKLNDPKTVIIVSKPNWQETHETLMTGDFGQTSVMTPELITIAGLPFTQLGNQCEAVKNRIGDIVKISADHPETTYLLGTPRFTEEGKKPFNSSLKIKAGKIDQCFDKKLLVADELEYFQTEPAARIAQTHESVVICRDLIGAQKQYLQLAMNEKNIPRNALIEYVHLATNNEAYAQQFKDAQFIPQDVKKILLQACWGIGLQGGMYDNLPQKDIDEIYANMLKHMSNSLFKINPHLNQIIVCDRAPIGVSNARVSSKPLNVVFFRN